MISTFTVLIDANVFYGHRLRSLVLWLAQAGLFRARWSEDIHREWMGHLRANRPDLDPAAITKTRELMDKAVLDSLVTCYEGLIPSLTLPDEDDRHVLAAAIVARASTIVTFNASDFPPEVLHIHGIQAVHPDDFLLDQEALDASLFVAAVRKDFQHYVRPPLTLDEYIESLRRAAVPRTADRIGALRVLLS